MVRWTYTSKADLLQIYNYISRDSIYYAKKVVNDIVDKSENLDTFPCMGRKVEELEDENLREIVVYSYRMIYRIAENNDIHVLAIVHCKRNLTKDILSK
ncbi:MAG TPA: type II toxin-antitoxin system RelE/ParE family toxin [Ruminiclostridium sp.]